MARRKEPPQWYIKFSNWLLFKLDGVWLDPIFAGGFLVLAAASLVGGILLQKERLYYSAGICALAGLMVLRRMQRIKAREKEEKDKK